MKIVVIGTGYRGLNIIKNLLVFKQEVVLYDDDKSNLRNALKRFHECTGAGSLKEILLNHEIKGSSNICSPKVLH